MNRRIFILLVIIGLSICNRALGQGEANVWYFGKGDGLDFNYNPPAALTNGNVNLEAVATGEGVGSMSDANGNLLFYTNGNVIYDKTHTAMPNGTGLNGDDNAVQTGLIVPVNGNPNQYYLISTGSGGNKPVKWVTIDMTLPGNGTAGAPLGDVVIASKAGSNGTTLIASASEGGVAIPEYTAANVPTGNYWIINHITAGDDYYVSKATATGISLVSTQKVGFVNGGQGVQMYKTNSCFDKIGVALYNFGRVEILPFNNVTGAISAPTTILNGTGGAPFLNLEVYGIEFSPSGQFLYVTESGLNGRKTVYQFDITAGSTVTNDPAILASKSYYSGGTEVARFGALQLGADARIYFPGWNTSGTNGYINVIPNPDLAWSKPTPTIGTDILYQNYTYVSQMGEGLPPVLKNLLTSVKIYYNNACEGTVTNFSYLFGGKAVSQTWDFGDPASGSNSSNSKAPSHTYSTAGTYTVTLTLVDQCGRTRTGTVDVIVKSGPTVSVPSSYCPNQNITITGTGSNKANYTWSLSPSMTSPSGPSSTYIYNGPLPRTVYVKDPTPLATYTVGLTTVPDCFAPTVGNVYFETFTTTSINSFQLTLKAVGSSDVSIQNAAGTTTYWGPTTVTGAANQVFTLNPNISLPAGKYRFYTSVPDAFCRNVTSTNDGGRDVGGVIDVTGENNGVKGGSFYNIGISIPDPCGVRAINLRSDLCCTPPSYTSPTSITSCEGVAASFTASTTGSSPTYQWQVSTDGGLTWTDISGATSATYTIPAGSVVYALNNNQYKAFITAAGCPFPTNAATLTILKPSVTSASLGTVCNGVPQNYDITSDIPATFTWSRAAVANISNTALSGQTSDPITESLLNTSTSPVNVVYNITPKSTTGSCTGFPSTYTVTVNPGPDYTLPATTCPNTNITISGVGPQAANYTWATSASGPFGSTGANYIYNGPLPATVYVKYPSTIVTAGNTDATAHNNNNIGDTRFDILTPVTLTSFQVRARLAAVSGTLTLQKWDGAAWVNTTGSEAWSTSYTTGAVSSLLTYTPNVTLSIGTYRLYNSTMANLWKNNTSRDGGRSISGIVTVNGDTDTGNNSKGGSFFNLNFAIPDPCGVRAITIPNNCCVVPTITTQPSSQTVCANTAVTFTVATSASSPTYKWQVSTDGGSTWSDIASATSASYTIAAGSVTTAINNYKYRAVINPTGCFANSNAATLTVNAIPVAPTVTTPVTYCQNAMASALAATGSNLLWYTVSSGGSGSATAPTPVTTTAGSPAATYYVSQTVSSCEGPRASIAVNVTALPAAPTVTTPVTYCQNATASALTATGSNLLWYTVSSGGSGSATAPTPSTATAGTPAITYYVSQTVSSCEGPRASIAVNVTALPASPTVTSPVTHCQNATAPALTATGSNLLWYTVSSGGSGSATAPTPVTTTAGSPAATYYVSQTVSSCEGPRASIAVNVTATPAAPTVTSPVTYCQNATASALTATGSNLLWYTVSSGGSGSATAPTPTTATAGTPAMTYYVSQTVSSCEGPRASIAVNVTALPAAPTVTSPVTYCQNATASALTATGSNLLWYTVSSGGSGSATAPTPVTTTAGSPAATYYVSQTVSSCEGPRASIAVNVTALPAAPTVTSPVTYCQNATASALTATGSNLLWYTVSSGGSGSGTAPTPSTATAGSPAATYYVSQTVSSCEGPRASIAVNVTALPAAPTVTSPLTYCQNATASALTATGSNLLWYTVSSGGSGSATAPTPSTATAGTPAVTYYVSQTVSSCEGPRASIAVNVTATPAAPTVTSPVTYCQNATASALTATGSNLLWYTVSSGGSGSASAPTPSTATAGTPAVTYYVSQTVSSCEGPRASIAVNVTALPAAPTVTSPVTYCQNATASALTATGSNLLWYTVSSGGSGSATAPTPSTATAGTPAVTYYVSQTVSSCEGPRASIAVNVTTLPAAPTVTSPVTYCQNATASALTATGSNLLWYTVSSGGSGSAAAPTPVTTTAGSPVTTYYVSQTVSSCEGPRASIAVNVTALPAAPTVTSSVTYCQNDVAAALTATGSNLLWYTVSSGGSGSASAPTPSTATAGTPAVTYYVSQTVSSCEGPRASIAVNVTATPAAPTVTSPVTYCQNEAAVPLTATGSNLLWYTASTGGTGSAPAPTPSTTTNGSTFYYVSQTISSCEGPRASINVIVGTSPSAPTVSNVQYCQNATASPLTATGTSLKWYTVSTGGSGSATAPTPSTTTIGTTSYWVSSSFGSCEGPRSQLDVTILGLPAAPTVTTPVTYCQNATASALTATGSNLLWYTVSSGGSGSATAPTPTTATAGTPAVTYYVSQTVSSCEGPRANIAVNVTATPAAPTVTSPVTYCQNATASALTATGSNLLWYTLSSGGSGSATAPTPSTATAGTPAVTYYVSQTVSSCEGPRASIAVNVTATPAAPTVISPVTYCQNATASALTATGSNLLWYTASSGGSGSATAPTPVTTTAGSPAATYYVSQTVSSCEGPRASIAVNVTATPAAPTVTSPVTYCQNATASALTATGSNLLWYTVSSGGSGSSTAPTPVTTTAGSPAATYYVSQTVSSCEGPRASIAVNVTALPAAPTVTSPVTYCQNATASALTATGSNLLWYTVSSGGSGSATAPTPSTVTAGTPAVTYYVSQTVSSCESPRASIAVNVTATPAAPTVISPVTYCQNATASALTATGSNLLWYTVSSGGSGSATAPTPSTATAGTPTVTYYVSQTVSSCEGPRAQMDVNVTGTPSAPTITSPVTYCQNATASALTATGSNLLWYTALTGGTGSAVAPIPSTATAGSPAVTYYVSQTLGCEGPRAPIDVNITATPAVPSVLSLVSYCQNATASALTATGSNLLWYTVSTGGTGSATAPTPSTATAGTPAETHYVTQTVSGCEGPRAQIDVNVTGTPSAPAVSSPVTYCQNATASALTATGSNLLWYTVSTGGTGSATAPIPSTATAGTPAETHYVTQTVSGCESPTSQIDVNVTGTPSAPTVSSPVTYCQNATASALTATGSNLLWYTVSTGGTGSATAPTPSTVTAGTPAETHYVTQTVNGCESPSAQIDVNVTGTPLAPTVTSPVTYCQNATASALTATGSNLLWYTVSTGGTGSATAPTPSTATAGAPAETHYVTQTVSGCESPSTQIEVNVIGTPLAPTVTSPVTYCQNATASALKATGSNLLWYTVSTGGTGSATAPTPSTATAGTPAETHYVTQTVSGCESPSAQIDVNVTQLPVQQTLTGDQVCSGNAANVAVNSTELLVSYQASIGGVNVGSPVSGTGSLINLTIPASSLVAGTTTINVTAIGCSSVPLTSTAQVTVLGNPGSISGTPQIICDNAITGLTYTVPSVAGASYYEWTLSNGTLNSGQGTTSINVDLGSSPTTITVKPYVAFPGLSCTSASYIVSQKASYTGLDNLVIDEDSICKGNTINISIANQSADSYTWPTTLPAGASYVTNGSTSRTVSFGTSGIYTISVQPVQQCNASITPITTAQLVIIEPPFANAGGDIDMAKFQTVTLTGTGSVGNVYAYEWTSNPSSTITSPKTLITTVTPNATSTDYTLRVYTKNTKGCEATDVMKVEVDFVVKIPNAFSPNGDGNHDQFVIQNIQYFPNAKLYVYNQWGELIFTSDSGYPEAWDGKRNGNDVPVSAYYYVLEFNEGDKKAMTGEINVIR